MDWEQRCKELQQRVEELERENQELRRKLGYPELVQHIPTGVEVPDFPFQVLLSAAAIPCIAFPNPQPHPLAFS